MQIICPNTQSKNDRSLLQLRGLELRPPTMFFYFPCNHIGQNFSPSHMFWKLGPECAFLLFGNFAYILGMVKRSKDEPVIIIFIIIFIIFIIIIIIIIMIGTPVYQIVATCILLTVCGILAMHAFIAVACMFTFSILHTIRTLHNVKSEQGDNDQPRMRRLVERFSSTVGIYPTRECSASVPPSARPSIRPHIRKQLLVIASSLRPQIFSKLVWNVPLVV